MATVRKRDWEDTDEPNAKRLKKNESAFVEAFTVVEDQIMADVAAVIPEAAPEPAVVAESEVNCLATGWVQLQKAFDVTWKWLSGGIASDD